MLAGCLDSFARGLIGMVIRNGSNGLPSNQVLVVQQLIVWSLNQWQLVQEVDALLKQNRREEAIFRWQYQLRIEIVELNALPTSAVRTAPSHLAATVESSSRVLNTSHSHLNELMNNLPTHKYNFELRGVFGPIEIPLGMHFVKQNQPIILTSVTNRCVFAILSALNHQQVNLIIPFGLQRGIGKAALVRGLAQMLMRLYVEITCLPTTTVNGSWQRLIDFTIAMNGWMVFREMTRLVASVLHAVHGNLLESFTKRNFRLLGGSNPVMNHAHHESLASSYRSCGFFMPMQGHLLEKSSLFMTLKGSFRPIVIVPPSMEVFTKVMLESHGFANEQLCRSVVAFFLELHTSLWASTEMPAITASLGPFLVRKTIAEALRTKEIYTLRVQCSGASVQDKALMCDRMLFRNAIISCMPHCFSGSPEDAVWNQLLKKHFPVIDGFACPLRNQEREESVRDAMMIFLEQSRLAPNDEMLRKGVDLCCSLDRYVGSIVFGEAGQGKSTIIRALHGALCALEYAADVEKNYLASQSTEDPSGPVPEVKAFGKGIDSKLITINPQLLSLDQLYGIDLDLPYQEKYTSLLSELLYRDADSLQDIDALLAEDDGQMVERTIRIWLHLDGTLHGEWIEPLLALIHRDNEYMVLPDGQQVLLLDRDAHRSIQSLETASPLPSNQSVNRRNALRQASVSSLSAVSSSPTTTKPESSSGQSCLVTRSIRLLFESIDISTCSPALLHAVQLVFISNKAVTYEHLLTQWQSKMEHQFQIVNNPALEERRDKLLFVFRTVDFLVRSVLLEYYEQQVRNDAVSAVPSSDGSIYSFGSFQTLVYNSLQLLTALFQQESQLEDHTNQQIAQFVLFGLSWGFGGHMEETARLRLDLFLKERLKLHGELRIYADQGERFFESRSLVQFWSSLKPNLSRQCDLISGAPSEEVMLFDSHLNHFVVNNASTSNLLRLSRNLLRTGIRSFIIFGPNGSGKSCFLRFVWNENEQQFQNELEEDRTFRSRHSRAIVDWMKLSPALFAPRDSFFAKPNIHSPQRRHGDEDDVESSIIAPWEKDLLNSKQNFIFLEDLDIMGNCGCSARSPMSTLDNDARTEQSQTMPSDHTTSSTESISVNNATTKHCAHQSQLEFIRVLLDHQLFFSPRQHRIVTSENLIGGTAQTLCFARPSEANNLALAKATRRFLRHFALWRIPVISRNDLLTIFKTKLRPLFLESLEPQLLWDAESAQQRCTSSGISAKYAAEVNKMIEIEEISGANPLTGGGGTANGGWKRVRETILRATVDFALEVAQFQAFSFAMNRPWNCQLVYNLHHLNEILHRTLKISHSSVFVHGGYTNSASGKTSNSSPTATSSGATNAHGHTSVSFNSASESSLLLGLDRMHRAWYCEVRNVYWACFDDNRDMKKQLTVILRTIGEKHFNLQSRELDTNYQSEIGYLAFQLMLLRYGHDAIYQNTLRQKFLEEIAMAATSRRLLLQTPKLFGSFRERLLQELTFQQQQPMDSGPCQDMLLLSASKSMFAQLMHLTYSIRMNRHVVLFGENEALLNLLWNGVISLTGLKLFHWSCTRGICRGDVDSKQWANRDDEAPGQGDETHNQEKLENALDSIQTGPSIVDQLTQLLVETALSNQQVLLLIPNALQSGAQTEELLRLLVMFVQDLWQTKQSHLIFTAATSTTTSVPSRSVEQHDGDDEDQEGAYQLLRKQIVAAAVAKFESLEDCSESVLLDQFMQRVRANLRVCWTFPSKEHLITTGKDCKALFGSANYHVKSLIKENHAQIQWHMLKSVEVADLHEIALEMSTRVSAPDPWPNLADGLIEIFLKHRPDDPSEEDRALAGAHPASAGSAEPVEPKTSARRNAIVTIANESESASECNYADKERTLRLDVTLFLSFLKDFFARFEFHNARGAQIKQQMEQAVEFVDALKEKALGADRQWTQKKAELHQVQDLQKRWHDLQTHFGSRTSSPISVRAIDSAEANHMHEQAQIKRWILRARMEELLMQGAELSLHVEQLASERAEWRRLVDMEQSVVGLLKWREALGKSRTLKSRGSALLEGANVDLISQQAIAMALVESVEYSFHGSVSEAKKYACLPWLNSLMNKKLGFSCGVIPAPQSTRSNSPRKASSQWSALRDAARARSDSSPWLSMRDLTSLMGEDCISWNAASSVTSRLGSWADSLVVKLWKMHLGLTENRLLCDRIVALDNCWSCPLIVDPTGLLARFLFYCIGGNANEQPILAQRLVIERRNSMKKASTNLASGMPMTGVKRVGSSFSPEAVTASPSPAVPTSSGGATGAARRANQSIQQQQQPALLELEKRIASDCVVLGCDESDLEMKLEVCRQRDLPVILLNFEPRKMTILRRFICTGVSDASLMQRRPLLRTLCVNRLFNHEPTDEASRLILEALRYEFAMLNAFNHATTQEPREQAHAPPPRSSVYSGPKPSFQLYLIATNPVNLDQIDHYAHLISVFDFELDLRSLEQHFEEFWAKKWEMSVFQDCERLEKSLLVNEALAKLLELQFLACPMADPTKDPVAFTNKLLKWRELAQQLQKKQVEQDFFRQIEQKRLATIRKYREIGRDSAQLALCLLESRFLRNEGRPYRDLLWLETFMEKQFVGWLETNIAPVCSSPSSTTAKPIDPQDKKLLDANEEPRHRILGDAALAWIHRQSARQLARHMQSFHRRASEEAFGWIHGEMDENDRQVFALMVALHRMTKRFGRLVDKNFVDDVLQLLAMEFDWYELVQSLPAGCMGSTADQAKCTNKSQDKQADVTCAEPKMVQRLRDQVRQNDSDSTRTQDVAKQSKSESDKSLTAKKVVGGGINMRPILNKLEALEQMLAVCQSRWLLHLEAQKNNMEGLFPFEMANYLGQLYEESYGFGTTSIKQMPVFARELEARINMNELTEMLDAQGASDSTGDDSKVCQETSDEEEEEEEEEGEEEEEESSAVGSSDSTRGQNQLKTDQSALEEQNRTPDTRESVYGCFKWLALTLLTKTVSFHDFATNLDLFLHQIAAACGVMVAGRDKETKNEDQPPGQLVFDKEFVASAGTKDHISEPNLFRNQVTKRFYESLSSGAHGCYSMHQLSCFLLIWKAPEIVQARSLLNKLFPLFNHLTILDSLQTSWILQDCMEFIAKSDVFLVELVQPDQFDALMTAIRKKTQRSFSRDAFRRPWFLVCSSTTASGLLEQNPTQAMSQVTRIVWLHDTQPGPQREQNEWIVGQFFGSSFGRASVSNVVNSKEKEAIHAAHKVVRELLNWFVGKVRRKQKSFPRWRLLNQLQSNSLETILVALVRRVVSTKSHLLKGQHHADEDLSTVAWRQQLQYMVCFDGVGGVGNLFTEDTHLQYLHRSLTKAVTLFLPPSSCVEDLPLSALAKQKQQEVLLQREQAKEQSHMQFQAMQHASDFLGRLMLYKLNRQQVLEPREVTNQLLSDQMPTKRTRSAEVLDSAANLDSLVEFLSKFFQLMQAIYEFLLQQDTLTKQKMQVNQPLPWIDFEEVIRDQYQAFCSVNNHLTAFVRGSHTNSAIATRMMLLRGFVPFEWSLALFSSRQERKMMPVSQLIQQLVARVRFVSSWLSAILQRTTSRPMEIDLCVLNWQFFKQLEEFYSSKCQVLQLEQQKWQAHSQPKKQQQQQQGDFEDTGGLFPGDLRVDFTMEMESSSSATNGSDTQHQFWVVRDELQVPCGVFVKGIVLVEINEQLQPVFHSLPLCRLFYYCAIVEQALGQARANSKTSPAKPSSGGEKSTLESGGSSLVSTSGSPSTKGSSPRAKLSLTTGKASRNMVKMLKVRFAFVSSLEDWQASNMAACEEFVHFWLELSEIKWASRCIDETRMMVLAPRFY